MQFLKLLAKLYGFDPKKAGKIVLARHKPDDDAPELASYIKQSTGNFEKWQCIQRKENIYPDGRITENKGGRFWECCIVVSFRGAEFYGEKGKHARFVGIYRNHSHNGLPEKLDIDKHLLPLSPEFADIYRKHHKRKKGQRYFFNFREAKEFNADDLAGRAVVNWPYGTRNWAQIYKSGISQELEVLEVLPRGYVRSFPGIERCMPSFSELQKIVENPAANREWYTALSSVAGIYAILHGDQLYIGKASGTKGIIGRWATYIRSGHGGNEKLKNLLRKNPNAKYDFQFSVLQALSPSLSPKQVGAMETLWKQKLGSRKGEGLNIN